MGQELGRDTDAKQSRSDFVVIILLVIPSGKSAQTINDWWISYFSVGRKHARA